MLFVSLITGAIILSMLIPYISRIINMLNSFCNKTSINSDFLALLLKITGIAFLTEFAVSVCKDSGEIAISNKIDLGGKIIIISMSIPIISSLLQTITKVMS